MNNWFVRIIASSIGKKLIMAITGLFFCIFLFVHIIDNMMIYKGKAAFDAYVKALHSFPLFIAMVEIGLILFAFLHIGFGLVLFYQNWRARPINYSVKKWAGGRTLSSSLMPYTGLYILIFVVIHLINFRLAVHSGKSIYEMLSSAFSNPVYVLYYALSMIVVALHVRHGFWSAFQSLGLNHPKYMPFIEKMGIVFAIILAISMGCVPVYFYL
ncbi:MAG: succinate dehydrogenase [Deltaproteobacteria bacterium]|nr:MAG: succinate dehydrogenase [Deltaproteobacteria bacterium]